LDELWTAGDDASQAIGYGIEASFDELADAL
jgi:hypothetical protein